VDGANYGDLAIFGPDMDTYNFQLTDFATVSYDPLPQALAPLQLVTLPSADGRQIPDTVLARTTRPTTHTRGQTYSAT
jgi:hypothetical protein